MLVLDFDKVGSLTALEFRLTQVCEQGRVNGGLCEQDRVNEGLCKQGRVSGGLG